MQVAIFLALVLILVVLAPWLMGVIAVAVVAMGFAAVVAAGVALLAIICYLAYLAYRGDLLGTKEWRAARRMKKVIDASNRRYREGGPD